MTDVRSRGAAAAQLSVIRGGQPSKLAHSQVFARSGDPATRPLAIELHSPVQDHLRAFVEENATLDVIDVAPPNVFAGQSVAICGAGPSLRDETIRGVDQIWACNSALPYLVAAGAPVTAGIGIDQTPGLLREWGDPPDVCYYVASSCDPALIRHLRSHGRRVVFFHSFVACASSPEEEKALYERFPGPTVIVGEGMTVATRSIGLAHWMGFRRMDLYGVDCCFALGDGDDVTHANGETATAAYGRPIVMEATLRGRRWRTRPDMLFDAVRLAQRVHASGGRIRLIGDTLPVFLLGEPDSYLDQVCIRGTPAEIAARLGLALPVDEAVPS